MEPYARALLMLLYVLNGGQMRSGPGNGQPRPEVFSFATRLTRLTPALSAANPDTMLAKAGEAAPDWSGGTRIGAAVKEFNDHYGSRGLARGAVILIISDGWETGDPALLGAQMARLSRVAHRIVWANPRTQSPALPPRGRRHGRRLALLRRHSQRPQPGLPRRPALRPQSPLTPPSEPADPALRAR